MNQRIRLQYIAYVIAVGQHDAFGLCRCSRGIGNVYQIIARDGSGAGFECFSVFFQPAVSFFFQSVERFVFSFFYEAIADDEYFFDQRHFRLYVADLFDVMFRNNDEPGIRMDNAEYQFFFCQFDAERNIYPSGIQHAELTVNPIITSFA